MEQTSNQIIKDILALPGAKYLALILQESLPKTTREDDRNFIKWLLEGKYINDSQINDCVERYQQDNKSEVIQDVVNYALSVVPSNIMKVLDLEIINLFSKSGQANIIIGKSKLLNHLKNIYKYANYPIQYEPEIYLFNFLATGENPDLDQLIDEYFEFIVTPAKLVENIIKLAPEYNYEFISEQINQVVLGLISEIEPSEEYQLELAGLPDDKKLPYILETLSKLVPAAGADITGIYNYFYPAPSVPEPPVIFSAYRT